MLDIFIAGGQQNYAKAAGLYVHIMFKYGEGSPEQQAIIESVKMTGSHVVRYLSHEWSGIWNNLCIEQTLMSSSKSKSSIHSYSPRSSSSLEVDG